MWRIVAICAFGLAVEANGWPESSNFDSDPLESSPGCVADDIPDSDQSGPILGAYEYVDKSGLDSPDIQDVAKFATSELAARLYSPNGFNLVNVNSANKQVVSGVNYNMNIVVVPNQCEREGEAINQDGSCPPGPCDKALTCDITVYAIPWLHQMKLDAFTCKPDQTTCQKDPGSF